MLKPEMCFGYVGRRSSVTREQVLKGPCKIIPRRDNLSTEQIQCREVEYKLLHSVSTIPYFISSLSVLHCQVSRTVPSSGSIIVNGEQHRGGLDGGGGRET